MRWRRLRWAGRNRVVAALGTTVLQLCSCVLIPELLPVFCVRVRGIDAVVQQRGDVSLAARWARVVRMVVRAGNIVGKIIDHRAQ